MESIRVEERRVKLWHRENPYSGDESAEYIPGEVFGTLPFGRLLHRFIIGRRLLGRDSDQYLTFALQLDSID